MKKNGFTLTELLVVLAILAILAAVLVPTLSSVNKKANKTADQTTAESIDTCIYEWMTTEYDSNALYKDNLYNNEDISSLGLGFIGGDSENMYCYNYAGTEQLPGVELTNELQIRQFQAHISVSKTVSSLLTDLKAVRNTGSSITTKSVRLTPKKLIQQKVNSAAMKCITTSFGLTVTADALTRILFRKRTKKTNIRTFG